MKIKLLPALSGLFALQLCGLSTAYATLRVVTSFYPVYVSALNVVDGIEDVEVHNLAAPHIGCLHDYQLTAVDARRLADAGLFLENGAGMEAFADKVRAQNPHLEIADVSAGIPLIGENPHLWVSPRGAARQVDNIAQALSRADPSNAARYASNAAAYKDKLSALAASMKSALASYAGSPVVTLHDTFPYFADEFGLDIIGVIEREAGRAPSAKQLAATVDLVRAKGVKVILAEPQYPDMAAQTVARETGAKVYQIDPVVTGPSDPVAARGAYLRAMEKNLSVLQDAFRP